MAEPRTIVLHRIEAPNVRRHYAIVVVDEPLFGRVWIELQWGRIGARKLKTKRETFASSRALASRYAEILESKLRRGYRAPR